MPRLGSDLSVRKITVHSTAHGDVEVLANVLANGTFIHREFDGWTVRYPGGGRVGWKGVVMIRLEKSVALEVARVIDVAGDDTDNEVIQLLLEEWKRLTGETWEEYADRFWTTYRAAVARGEDFTQHLYSL